MEDTSGQSEFHSMDSGISYPTPKDTSTHRKHTHHVGVLPAQVT